MSEAINHAGTVIARPANSLAQAPEIVRDFICEPREHLASIESRMLVLEQNPADMEALHSAFRGFHTIKGLAGLLRMKLAGARTIAQDERSSVVFRVPRGSHPHRGSGSGWWSLGGMAAAIMAGR